MSRFACRAFGCRSPLSRWFGWPHELCTRAMRRKCEGMTFTERTNP